MESGAWEEELELMRTAMALCEDRESLMFANLANSLAATEYERGHIEAAHVYMDKSLEIRQRVLDPNHVEVANSYNNYANIIRLEIHYMTKARLTTPSDIGRKLWPYSRKRTKHIQLRRPQS